MKQSIHSLFVFSLAVLSLVACSREAELPEPLPERQMKQLILSASVESGSETRTVLRDRILYWQPGDQISLFYGSGTNGGAKFTSIDQAETLSAHFSGMIDIIEGGSENAGDLSGKKFIGVYPYRDDIVCDGSTITTTLPDVQTAVEGSFDRNLFISMGRSSGLEMKFYNVCSGLYFTISHPNICQIEFSGNAGEVLAGEVKVGFDANGKPEVKQVLNGKTKITLIAPNGGEFEVGKTYCLVSLPVQMTASMKVAFIKTDATSGLRKWQTANITLGRNQLLTYTPLDADDYTTVKLPYRYDENATCPNIENFLDDVTCGNKKDRMLLEEFLGYLLLPNCKFQKALMLIGEGSNGKSVFVNLAKKMLGGTSGYVSTVEPSKLAKDFRLMPFKKSWVNISSDSDSDLRGAEGEFKKIVAGEDLEDSYKFHSPFSFPTRSKMMMCCNKFPTVIDTSEGFIRRFLILKFKRHYVSPNRITNENDRPIDIDLEAKLVKELPGLFNLALKGLQRLLAQGQFTVTDEQEELINNFIGHNVNSMSLVEEHEELFFDVKDTVKEGKTVDKRKVYRDYKRWSEETNEFPMSRKKFYAAITMVFARLGWKFTEKDNFWTFEDIKLTDEQMDEIASEE